ncbi:Triacylglycerol lipase 2 [Spatholobus suberectus]|nr:Triacylglycerol lipase 2 [Spatholobus suberectus]
MVTTEDGYILSLQRLPIGRYGKKADKPPVLLQHGLFCDAIIWLVNCPDESLGFILADNGYDVWLANARGTKYSRGHKSLKPNDTAYWDWSWDELASYDLPAFVKYVYSNTGQRMHYAGHSLGTLMALATFSQGQLLDMLRSAALLSPIAHTHQVTSPLVKLAADTFIANHLYWLGLREFIPNGDVAGKFMKGICNSLNFNCSNLLTLFTGTMNICNQQRRTRLASSVGHLTVMNPKNGTTKSTLHEPLPATCSANLTQKFGTIGCGIGLQSPTPNIQIALFEEEKKEECFARSTTQGRMATSRSSVTLTSTQKSILICGYGEAFVTHTQENPSRRFWRCVNWNVFRGSILIMDTSVDSDYVIESSVEGVILFVDM